MSVRSIQLIKSLVVNNQDKKSYRLIEKEMFELWRYLVMTKHHIEIIESFHCLWVSQQEYDEKVEIFQRAGESEKANRILLMIDDIQGTSKNTYRYVLDADTRDTESILLARVHVRHRDVRQYSIEITPGQIIVKEPWIVEDADLELPAYHEQQSDGTTV